LKGEGSMLEMMTKSFTAAIHTAFPMGRKISKAKNLLSFNGRINLVVTTNAIML
jgi:hypothetical protein